jgi:thiamine biosynthesis lipoprotein
MNPQRVDRRELFASLAPSEPAGGHWLRVQRPAMACRFEVVLDSADAAFVPAARAALDEVDTIEAALTYFRETSELSNVNRQAAQHPVAVSAELFALLQLCGEIYRVSGGAFDPTSTPLSRAWGFLARQGRLPGETEIAEARARTGWEHVRLDHRARAVSFLRPGLELNLGSIGKGWALDRVTAGLRARGVSRALLSAGGSSQRSWGRRAWEVALTTARETLALVRLREAALGTSGAGEQYFEVEGRRFGHVIDARSGWPAQGVRSATVIAEEAAAADALATALFVGGPVVAADLCATRPGTLAILVLEDEPHTLRVFGAREGIAIEPVSGVRVVEQLS